MRLAPVTVTLSTTLDCPAEEVWAQLHSSSLLLHIAAPLIRFSPKGAEPFPMRWEPREYRAWMWLFGLIPIGWQAVVISEPPPDGATRFLRDNGYGPLIKRWDHWIAVTPLTDGTTHYVDRVDIDAGVLTPLIERFARLFYAHRQRRWRKLAQTGFAALKP